MLHGPAGNGRSGPRLRGSVSWWFGVDQSSLRDDRSTWNIAPPAGHDDSPPSTVIRRPCTCSTGEEYGELEYGELPVNHAMFPNYRCDNSFRDATYDEVHSAISNTFHINGFRYRRACSVSSLMFHRVNRTSRYPRGWSEWLVKRRSPAGGFVRGTRFVVQSLCGLGWWVSERSSLSAQAPLGAKILPVEQTIRRWRVGAGQDAS